MLNYIIALMSGIAMGLTPAPLCLWPLAWLALAPLWILLKLNSPKIDLKKNILLAYCWGFGYYGLALFWITGIHPMTWMGVPWLSSLLIAIFCWLFITSWGAVLVISWSWAMTWIMKLKLANLPVIIRPFWQSLTGAALWCVLETIWSNTPLWWSTLAYTQSPNNLAILQLSQFSGATTITAAIVLVNGLCAEAILSIYLNKNYRYSLNYIYFIFPLICFISFHLIGFFLYNIPVEKNEKTAIKIGIIQGNIPNEIKLYYAGWRKAIEGYTTGYQTLANQGVNIVLTPETALPFYWEDIVSSRNSFYQAILEFKIPVWLGVFGKGNNNYTNSLFTITGEGKVFSRYDKSKLVPLGEYIPFASMLGNFISRLSPLDAHLQTGKPNSTFDTPVGRAIVGICYESAFAEHFRGQTAKGGEFIITASNNAHYSLAMPAQHHALDILRAIETDRWAARATNTGYSAIVNPRGKTIWISQINNYQLHVDKIYRRNTQTLYVRWGDWLTVSLVIMAIFIPLFFSKLISL